MRRVSDVERRARLAGRHAFMPGARAESILAATEAVVALHATEPHTPYLSLAARLDGVSVADIDDALYNSKVIVKQLAMRRTLFAFPRELLPAVWGSAAARVAAAEHDRLGRELVRAGVTDDGEAWLARAESAVRARLSGGHALSAARLRAELPELAGRTREEPDKPWGASVPFGPRVLTVMGAAARLMRGCNDGHWRTSRPQWTLTEDWLPDGPLPQDALPEAAGYAALIERYLERFGPVTETDLVWWLGATKAAVRRALAALEAVEVALDGGSTGWVLPDDLAPQEPPAEPWAALLPVLDPTTMGWKQRDFFLAPELAGGIFDRNGNGGTTAWWDGRVVGAWVQRPDGSIVVGCPGELGAEARAALDAEARRLSAWLDGQVITPIYKSPLMKELLG